MDMFRILEDPPSEDDEDDVLATFNEGRAAGGGDSPVNTLAARPSLVRNGPSHASQVSRRPDNSEGGHYARGDVERGRGGAPAAALEDFMHVLKRELNGDGEMAVFADILRQYVAPCRPALHCGVLWCDVMHCIVC
jgi:hypothetical protein